MQIIRMKVGDVLELKKPHPCGDKRFRVMRVGSEVRIVCLGCGRDMVLERIKRVFYRSYPNSNIVFNYRVGPLSSKGMAPEEEAPKTAE